MTSVLKQTLTSCTCSTGTPWTPQRSTPRRARWILGHSFRVEARCLCVSRRMTAQARQGSQRTTQRRSKLQAGWARSCPSRRALVRAVIGARTITTHSWAKLRELATMLAKRICRASVPVLALRARPTTALVYCAQPRRWRTAEPSHSGTGCGRRRAMDLREED